MNGDLDSVASCKPESQDAKDVRLHDFRNRVFMTSEMVAWAVVDPEGCFLDCNDAYGKILGYCKDELSRLKNFDVTHPDDLALTQGYMDALLKGACESHRAEKRYVRKDGDICWCDVTVFALRDDGSHASAVVALILDISERKRIESERARLEAAVNAAAEVFVVTDRDGNIEYVNPAFSKITGYALEEVLGKTPRILKSGRHNEAFYSDLWSVIKGGNVWSGLITNKRKNGKCYEEELTIAPVLDEAGEIRNFVAVQRDVTEQLRLEQSLRQAQKMEAIGTLAGGIAHDFNNILAAILGYTELVEDSLDDRRRVLEDLGHVRQAVIRARELVQQILTFSRKREQERRPVRVDLLVRETSKLIRSTVTTSVEIKTAICKTNRCVLGDPTELHQVLMNLCTNAYQAIGEQAGLLTIELQECVVGDGGQDFGGELPAGPCLKVCISDTGCGISPDILDRIFDPFFTTKRQGQGTGLGLSTVHGIVKSHGGAIQVASVPGRGSTFTVYLPCVVDAPADVVEEATPIPGGNERILIIDDEAQVARICGDILRRLGYDIVEMTDSPEAIRVFSRNPRLFDLIISDQQMPGLTGKELFRQVRSLRPDLPMIIMTGYSEMLTPEVARQMGVSAFLYKPIEKRHLARQVRAVLDTAKVERERES